MSHPHDVIPDSPIAAARRRVAVALLVALDYPRHAAWIAANEHAPKGQRRTTIDVVRDELQCDMEAPEKQPRDGDTRTAADFLAVLDALGALWAVS